MAKAGVVSILQAATSAEEGTPGVPKVEGENALEVWPWPKKGELRLTGVTLVMSVGVLPSRGVW